MSDLPAGVSDHFGGMSEWVKFDKQRDMAKAVGYLLGCHSHRLIVLAHTEPSLVMTPMGLECLRQHFSDHTLVEVDE